MAGSSGSPGRRAPVILLPPSEGKAPGPIPAYRLKMSASVRPAGPEDLLGWEHPSGYRVDPAASDLAGDPAILVMREM